MMLAVELRCSPAQRDWLIALLWEQGTVGIIEHEQGLTAYFDGADPGLLRELLADYDPRIREEPAQDWEAVARAPWKPLQIGRRFFLAPTWCTDPTPPGRLRLIMRPGQACGTGLHPATQLCLELVEELVRPGACVLDVGTGSGLLAAAAALLGAGRVVACDVDAAAAEEARDRFQAERLNVVLFRGSLRALRGDFADLALVNIHAEAVVALAGELVRVLVPGGAAVAAGFRGPALERVRAALAAAGLPPVAVHERQGWLAVVARRIRDPR